MVKTSPRRRRGAPWSRLNRDGVPGDAEKETNRGTWTGSSASGVQTGEISSTIERLNPFTRGVLGPRYPLRVTWKRLNVRVSHQWILRGEGVALGIDLFSIVPIGSILLPMQAKRHRIIIALFVIERIQTCNARKCSSFHVEV